MVVLPNIKKAYDKIPKTEDTDIQIMVWMYHDKPSDTYNAKNKGN